MAARRSFDVDKRPDRPTSDRRAVLWGLGGVAAGSLFRSSSQAKAGLNEIHVMISGGFHAAYQTLGPEFEHVSGLTLATVLGPSMGSAPTAIPIRLSRGEPADVIILAREALDQLVRDGRVVAGSETDLVRSRIGMAVRAGAMAPDISTPDRLRTVLLQARSIAYSDSASGVYVANELFNRLGIEDQVVSKAHKITATPVGEAIADGDADVGFQQLSELLPISGIQVVGPIPDAVQKVTIFSAGVSSTSTAPMAARRLIAFLASQQAWPAIRKTGLEPAAAFAK